VDEKIDVSEILDHKQLEVSRKIEVNGGNNVSSSECEQNDHEKFIFSLLPSAYEYKIDVQSCNLTTHDFVYKFRIK